MITMVELEGINRVRGVESKGAFQDAWKALFCWSFVLEWSTAINDATGDDAAQAGWERIHRFGCGKGGFLGAGADHLLAQGLDLGGHKRVHALRLRESDPAHHGGEEEFFEVGEREAFGGLRDARYSLGGEAQGGLQRLVPQADVCLAF